MAEVATGKITPIIVVHAVTAGGLHDRYPLDAERVWSPLEMALRRYTRIQLYPYEQAPADGPRYEAIEPALIRPSEAFGLIYDDLVDELQHNLSYGPTPTQPVYPFVYDWRQDNFLSAERLRTFVKEVIARTNLMPHDPKKVNGPLCDSVDLIGHSMGGLVVAGAIAGPSGTSDDWARQVVRRVVTLGTPFGGANASIQKLATGGGTMWGRSGKERERTMARVTPTVYQLLPSFGGAVVKKSGGDADIFDPKTFQPSIRRTIAEFVAEVLADRRAAKSKKRCREIAKSILDDVLGRAREFRALTDSVRPSMLRDDGAWLAIVGVGEKTNIKTGIGEDPNGKRWFDFEVPGAFSDDDWDGRKLETGDETVPLRGAIPPWPEPWRNTIVVRRQDFAWLGEMGDRVLCNQLGLHSTLPLLDLAQRWIINFLRPHWAGTPSLGQHGKLWARPLPGFPTSSSSGIATVKECQKEWRKLIPKVKLSDPD